MAPWNGRVNVFNVSILSKHNIVLNNNIFAYIPVYDIQNRHLCIPANYAIKEVAISNLLINMLLFPVYSWVNYYGKINHKLYNLFIQNTYRL